VIYAASDFHFPRADRAACRAFCKAAYRDEPACVVLNGDIVDGVDRKAEFRALREFGKLLHDHYLGPVKVVFGNHDAKFLEVVAGHPTRASIRALTSDFAEAFDRLSVQCYPKGLILDGFHFLHGTLHSEEYAKATMQKYGIADSTLIVGHTHRHQAFSYGRGAVYGLPCMAMEGVPGAALGWARLKSDGKIRSVELTTVIGRLR
jgi:metallophosphoesterase superfamily enzyme